MLLNNIELDTEKYYAASTIIKNGWFPWIKSPMTFLRILKNERYNLIYRPIITVAGQQTIRRIKGETILKVIDLANQGKLKHE